jgi:hypothetical protein
MKSILRISTLAFSSLLLTACGGGGGSDGAETVESTAPAVSNPVPQDVSANGLWSGTFTETGLGTFDVAGIFYDGRLIAISESANAIYDGSYTMDGETISAAVTGFEIFGGPFVTTAMTGNTQEASNISLSFSTSYGSNGTISLDYDATYDQPSSLEAVSDVWLFTDGGYSITLVVDDDGEYVGSASDGCLYSGRIGLLDPNKNLYDVSTSIENCGVRNGDYTGLTTLLNNQDVLYTTVSNDDFIFLYGFIRQ